MIFALKALHSSLAFLANRKLHSQPDLLPSFTKKTIKMANILKIFMRKMNKISMTINQSLITEQRNLISLAMPALNIQALFSQHNHKLTFNSFPEVIGSNVYNKRKIMMMCM